MNTSTFLASLTTLALTVGCTSIVTETADGPADGGGGQQQQPTVTVGPGGHGGDRGVGGGGAGGAGGDGGDAGGAGGEGGGMLSSECQALLDIEITEVTLDAGDDGVWSVGESVSVIATLLSPDDNFNYPGIRVNHNSALANPTSAENWLFGVLAGEPSALGVGFTARQVGTVSFEIEVGHINERCPGAATATITATIQ